MLFYIWVRFEWQFSVGAIVALFHDVLSTIGFFSLTQIEFNLASIAAILTIAGYSINDTVVILDPVTGSEAKAIVTDSGAYAASGLGAQVLTVQTFDNVALIAGNGWSVATDKKLFVYGSDYRKGESTAGAFAAGGLNQARISVEPQLTQYSNSPIILRNQYVVSGSDMAQIGWVEVATEDGTSGYLWYLKAESETRLRFEDYLEMSMVAVSYTHLTLPTNREV